MNLTRAAIFGGCLLVPMPGALGAEPPFPTGPYVDENAYISDVFANTTRIEANKAVGLIQAVELRVSDQVGDKCWTASDAVTARLRAEFERSDIAVYNEPLLQSVFTPVARMAVIGYRIGQTCIATIAMKIGFENHDRLGSLGYTGGVYRVDGEQIMWSNTSIHSSGKSLNDSVAEQAQRLADMIVADVLAARRDPGVKKLLAAWKDKEPQTQREFIAKFEQLMKERND